MARVIALLATRSLGIRGPAQVRPGPPKRGPNSTSWPPTCCWARAAHRPPRDRHGQGQGPASPCAARRAPTIFRRAVDIEAIRRTLHDHIVGELLLRDEPLGFDDDIFDAGFDSMSLSRLLVFIEERFGAVIPDEDVVIDDIATLNSMARFVATYVKDQ
ncbi:MAG: hypothetical protein DRI90_12100 [Deltaproteobacteria bacterium]|nr:MAG: hypothetical protein DRI90_12100 [Deltaproteobacteria bacterium]